jgi:hypothetical protein
MPYLDYSSSFVNNLLLQYRIISTTQPPDSSQGQAGQAVAHQGAARRRPPLRPPMPGQAAKALDIPAAFPAAAWYQRIRKPAARNGRRRFFPARGHANL